MTITISKFNLMMVLTVFCTLLLMFSYKDAEAANSTTCHGRLMDPITGPCWDCEFPMSIGGVQLFASKNRKDPKNPASPICACGTPIPRIGVSVGFWEPARVMDITQKPFCMVNMGGIKMPLPSIGFGRKATYYQEEGAKRTAYHVHYYIYPLLAMMNIVSDFSCMQPETFDVAYITEYDPLWNDDQLASIINPEVFLFSNPIAQLACAADCVAATANGLPLEPMFWCAGCQGSLYPMTGNASGNYGPLPAAELIADRFLAKMHRELLAWGTRGTGNMCTPKIQPIMDKMQYRLQEIYPKYHKDKYACAPIGKSTALYEDMKVVPYKGEDLGFLIWRKRNCCAL